MGAERKIVKKNAVFLGKRHDNRTLNLNILWSRNFVVIAQAPNQSRVNSPALILSRSSRVSLAKKSAKKSAKIG